MQITIIGHGNVGSALASNWASKGHHLIIGTRREEDEAAGELAEKANIHRQPMAEAVQQAGVVLVATPPTAAQSIVDTTGTMKDKILIDATNTIGKGPEPYRTAFELFRKRTEAKVVKCFNTTGFENMENPVYGNTAADMFMAGDSPEAKQVARQLALDAGFAACYDFGGDDQVEALEKLAYAWINLAIFQKHGRNMAFKLLRR